MKPITHVSAAYAWLGLLFAATASPAWAWETSSQAARQAFDLVHDPNVFGVATLSTKYAENVTDEFLRGQVISGPEYFAPCFPADGDLLFLGLKVSQTWRNVLSSDQKEATISIAFNADPSVPDPRHLSHRHSRNPHWDRARPSWRRGMPSKGRATLFGHFDLMGQEGNGHDDLAQCYLSHHPDASHWAPGSRDSPHIPFWAKFVVDRVYWVGGFGDEHFIGWLSRELWNKTWRERQTDGRSLRSAAESGSRSSSDHEPTPSDLDDHLSVLFSDAESHSNGEEPVQLRFQQRPW